MQVEVRTFAVVGAGPCGLYAVDRISRRDSSAAVDVFERLPTPFGLVRYGVAADHQITKGVTRVLGRALSRPNVRFFGNIEIGQDVSLETLRNSYDAVLIAIGASSDRKLDIPGEPLGNIVQSGQLVNWLNARPDDCAAPAELSKARHAVVIGLGNVALDVARLLLKDPDDLKGSDLGRRVSKVLGSTRIDRVTIVGRGGTEAARFSEPELKEITMLPYVGVSIDPELAPAPADPISAILGNARAAGRKSLRFVFQATPVRFLGQDDVTAVRVRRSDGVEQDIPADIVITCIGYSCTSLSDLAVNEHCFVNEGGKVDENLYVTGWASTGPRGTIASGRSAACKVADRMLAETDGRGRPGLTLPKQRVVDREGWQRIDAAEVAAAAPDRVREKIRTTKEMLSVSQVGVPATVVQDQRGIEDGVIAARKSP